MGKRTLAQVTHPKSDPLNPLTHDPVTHYQLWLMQLSSVNWATSLVSDSTKHCTNGTCYSATVC